MSNYLPDKTRYEKMKYNRCGRSGLLLPALSLGFWHNFGDASSFENQREIVRYAFDLGITHFDLATITDRRREARKRISEGYSGRPETIP